jgi:hypothetical protein
MDLINQIEFRYPALELASLVVPPRRDSAIAACVFAHRSSALDR